MKLNRVFFEAGIVLSMLTGALCFGEAQGSAVAGEVRVSLVTDSSVGPAIRHGLNKVKSALSQNGISLEEVESLEKARGKILIVASLSEGHTTAAQLLGDLSIPAPAEPESLLIRHIRWVD